jgi:outer membrane protein TolC
MQIGCAGALESQGHSNLAVFEKERSLTPPPQSLPEFDGTLGAYLAFALKHSPEARASFERWRAATLRISRGRRLPDPNISFGYFLRSIETRVGPQRFKVGLSQNLPWPTKLSAAADSASEKARAARRAVDVETLRIKRGVSKVYWTLWLIEEEHRLKTEHDAVLESLAGAVRGRLATGTASLADLNQIELNIARHHDHREHHKEARRKASARLFAAMGVSSAGRTLKATDQPLKGLPRRREEALRAQTRKHPRLTMHDHLAASESERARAEDADKFPKLRIGVDYIEVGDATMPGVPDSGKDPLVVSAGLSIPLWASSYSEAAEAAKAAASAHRADREAAEMRAEGAFDSTYADLNDAQRRIALYERTLVPQAESTYQAVLGSYQAGRSTVAAILLAQRDLLELQLDLAKARADHAQAWTSLEYIVGAELEASGESHE